MRLSGHICFQRNSIPQQARQTCDLSLYSYHPQTLIKAGEAEYIERLIQAVHVGALTEEQHMISDTEFYGMLLDGWPVRTITDEGKHGIRSFRKQIRKYIN